MIKLTELLSEEINNTYEMYSGITKEMWNKVWKNKNFTNRETNVTSDIDFASDYSYNFKTGKYEDLVVVIKNIPVDAFSAVRFEDYADDDDVESMEGKSDAAKHELIKFNTLFLINLYQYKNQIETELIST